MKLVHQQHLQSVLLCGLLLLFVQQARSTSSDDIREVIAPNSTNEKDPSPLKIENESVKRLPTENISDGINAVPLSPEDDVGDKSEGTDLSSLLKNGSVEGEKSSLSKDTQESVPVKSERTPKNLDTPSVNAVANDDGPENQNLKIKLQTNSTESPDEEKGTTKSSQDDLPQYEYPPKGRTISYKENGTNSDNTDVLKNTVPSEPKAVKSVEEGSEKEGERWIKKQRGISSPNQSSRLNKERNLSGSYLPALAALNTVNNTSESESTNDKFLIKYQRRKRPWSVQVNSSDLSLPEETTVWSLASLKSTPKEKQYGDVKPIVPWSTIINKPTTEFQPKLSSTPSPHSYSDLSTSLSEDDSDWVGISKVDISDVPSTKVSSTTTDSPINLIESNLTSPSSSLNLIDSSSDKDVSIGTSQKAITDEQVKVQNDAKPSSQTLYPEFSNIINESDSTVKPLPSTTTPAISTTVESVKNLSVYPSPISNSVNELHEEEESETDEHFVPDGPNFKKETSSDSSEPKSTDLLSSTESVPIIAKTASGSFDNSNHPNKSEMFSGKDTYAGSFDFTTPPTEKREDLYNTTKFENNSIESEVHITTPIPTKVTSTSPDKTTETSISVNTDKIAHVTSTMLPDKVKDSSEKSTPTPNEHPVAEISSDSTESEFNIGLTDLFNTTQTSESSVTSDSNPEKLDEHFNITTNQPKEFNEILLDFDKAHTSTEKIVKSVTTSTEFPSSSSTTSQETFTSNESHKNDTGPKTNENINVIDPLDVTEKTTTPKTSEPGREEEITSMKDEIKLFDLFNSTDDFMTSTISKYPGSVYSVDKVPALTTEEPYVNKYKHDSEKDINLASENETQVSQPKDTKETEYSTEVDDRTPDIVSIPVDNSTNPDEDSSPRDPSLDEVTPSVPSLVAELAPNSDVAVSGNEDHDKFPMSEEDTIFDTVDPVFTRLLIQANDKELCSRKEQLRDSIIRLFKTNGSEIHRKQVVINNLGPKDCLFRNPPSDDGLFPIQVYLTNSQGHNDMILTDKFIDLWQREGLDFSYPVKRVDKVIGRRKWVEMDNNKAEGNSSLIAAIVISSIAGVCLLFIVILLVIIRKRQKGFNYGQRCTPVSLEDYSLDNISVYNSTRRKAMRASKRSYGNPAFDDPGAISHVVNFATLANFSNNRSLIDEEFTQIPTVSVKPDELPSGVVIKNRFANVIPIPETRVTLASTKGANPDVDTYINANYVKGAKGEDKFYIACQAPMADTISDFWQMIWEQQSRLVIMLTDLQEGGIEKCADYLPPSEVLDCHRVFGDLQVTLKKREVREKYVISNLQLKNLENNLWREVVHLWLTCWPAQGVPSEPTAVIAFLIEARSYIKSKENSSPIVVHCSPGTGRTGTIIAIDICIRDFEVKRTIDVPRTVCNIRKDRAGAVQTKDQYAFIYQVLHLYATKLTGGGLDSI